MSGERERADGRVHRKHVAPCQSVSQSLGRSVSQSVFTQLLPWSIVPRSIKHLTALTYEHKRTQSRPFVSRLAIA